MTVSARTVWQVSAGPASRSYADVLLRHGVALIGPGDWGPWSRERYCGMKRWYYDDFAIHGFVNRFAEEVQPGDVFLLRTGISAICAVGIVASDYLYLNQFDDVNGWDLQHARRVRWYRLPEPHMFAGAAFGANPPRCSRVLNPEVVDFAMRFLHSPPTHWQTAALPPLPVEELPLVDVPEAISGLVAQAGDLLPLTPDGQRFGDLPSEDEQIVHFVVPLLRAFGWPPDLIAVKWRKIDIAVFRALPRTAENCHLVIEAKRLGAGVEGALEQAKGYVTALGATCDAIVTDGIRYRLYDGAGGFAPLAYANLARLKQSAVDLFARMQRP